MQKNKIELEEAILPSYNLTGHQEEFQKEYQIQLDWNIEDKSE